MRYLLLWLLVGVVTTPLWAQLDNRALRDNITLNPADSGKAGFQLQAFQYLRNTEYFNNIELGRTLFGTQLHPQVYYQPTPHIKLQGGVFLRSDYGATPAINQVLPTFSVKLSNPTQTRAFIFGTLEGALAHNLIEPLFDINAAIERRIENGAQFTLNKHNRYALDSWINWEKFIERGSPHKEQFTAGLNASINLLKQPAGSIQQSLKPVVQFTAHHRGGQIDADTTNMVMVFNGAAGLQYSRKTAPFSITAEAYGLFYRENSNSGYFAYRNGSGLWACVTATRNAFSLMPCYWMGNGYIAPRGTSIYQSVSIDKAGYTEKTRELLFVRALYAQTLTENMHLNVRFEPFWNLRNGWFDYSYSVYLSYRLSRSFKP